jgi:hypothetical protein
MTLTLRRLLLACLVLIAVFAGAVSGATQVVAVQPVDPVVLSGADIGFRMTGRKGDTPVGRLVVRVNGEWKEVEFTFALKPITQ